MMSLKPQQQSNTQSNNAQKDVALLMASFGQPEQPYAEFQQKKQLAEARVKWPMLQELTETQS